MEWLKKAIEVIKLYGKWVIFGLSALGLLILFILISRKNQRIRNLETDLAVSKAKLQVESLAMAYTVAVKELAELRKSEAELHKKLEAVEASLKEKLAPGMTADEVIAKMKELGLR